jgi:hypothetical protein
MILSAEILAGPDLGLKVVEVFNLQPLNLVPAPPSN